MNPLKLVPNFLTLLNLLAGILSILLVSKGLLAEASILIFIAAVFDFLDGFAARLLNAYSAIGAQLDSLADVVSFGVAPGFILHQLIIMSHGRMEFILFNIDIIPLLVFVVPLFAALRLAKFNVDTRQTDSFLGLPSPAAALLIASLPLVRNQLYEGQSLFYMVITNTYFYLGIAVVTSLLMVAELPLFGLKFKSFAFKGNEIRWLFLAISLALLLFFQAIAIPFIILIYLFLSLVVFLADIQQ
ncbi:MAG: CDP-diacylglycerol--serine O-phosphatidyltransferase [Bacteroidetes bacterium]|jgi:CDP-diacylglycerol--serine O-phosphatidyltransferase|nr:CDP-diacylglycerol--serine O-phosphatidyltransferase [Bacteroidota bacterium]